MGFYVNNSKIDVYNLLSYIIKDNKTKNSFYYEDENGEKINIYINKKGLLTHGQIPIYDLQIVDGKLINVIDGSECTSSYEVDSENGLFRFKEEKKTLITLDVSQGYSLSVGIKTEYDKSAYPLSIHNYRFGLDSSSAPLAFSCYPGGNYVSSFSLKRYENGGSNEPFYIVKDDDLVDYSFSLFKNKKIISLMGQIDESVFENTFNEIEIKTGYYQVPWIKYLKIYDKPLSKKGLINNFNSLLLQGILKSYEEKKYINAFDGLVKLGAIHLYKKNNIGTYYEVLNSEKSIGLHTETIDDISANYSIKDYVIPTLTSDEYTSLKFINVPIDNLQVGDVYSIRAIPYPYDVLNNHSFFIEYSSSDDSICSCLQGILQCNKTGTVEITATIQGTNITTKCKITIVEPDKITNNVCNISSDIFTKDLNYKQTSQVLFNAISSAITNGYNYIVLPKLDYHIIPHSYPCIEIGDNITIDMNGSSIYMEEHDGTWNLSGTGGSKGGYCLFSFVGKNSKVINGKYFGERYKNVSHDESEYTGYGLFARFMPGSYRCDIDNIIFNYTVGMNINVVSNAGSYSEGVGTRGRIYYADWEFGRFDEQGNSVVDNSYIRTKDYIDLGFSDTFSYDKYIVGLKGMRTYQTSSDRWHTIYWYDKDNNLLDVRIEHKFEEYKLPNGAVKYKLFMSGTTLPTQNYGEDQCTLRCFMMKEPKFINVTNCIFNNIHAGAINYVGGQRCRFSKCFISSNSVKPGMRWAIDYEDGWMNMRGNIIDNCIINGLVIQVSGNSNSYFNNYIEILQLNDECELGLLINNRINTISMNEKESGINCYNYYKKINSNTGLGNVFEFSNIEGI